jgi:hypothetical protein
MAHRFRRSSLRRDARIWGYRARHDRCGTLMLLWGYCLHVQDFSNTRRLSDCRNDLNSSIHGAEGLAVQAVKNMQHMLW